MQFNLKQLSLTRAYQTSDHNIVIDLWKSIHTHQLLTLLENTQSQGSFCYQDASIGEWFDRINDRTNSLGYHINLKGVMFTLNYIVRYIEFRKLHKILVYKVLSLFGDKYGEVLNVLTRQHIPPGGHTPYWDPVTNACNQVFYTVTCLEWRTN